MPECRIKEIQRQWERIAVAAFAVLLLVPIGFGIKKTVQTAQASGLISTAMSEQAVKAIKNDGPERIFNDYNVGETLIYNGIPVFFDARADLFAQENIMADGVSMMFLEQANPERRNMNHNMMLILPCYNEEAVLPTSYRALTEKCSEWISDGLISSSSKIVFVDDGSADDTWKLIQSFSAENRMVTGIKLSHNQGHQNALMAGLMYAREKCDFAVSLDVDLQDDIDAIPEFITKYEQGAHVVYGVRSERKKDTFFKRTTAQAFYKLMNACGAETVYNHADYRLMSAKALDALSEYEEANLFLRGIVPLIGLKSDRVYYARKERAAGETKYPFKKMMNFAFNGITSFSVKPLRFISAFGIICSVLSVAGLLYALISYFSGKAVPGWTAIVCSIWLLGGIQLLSIGVLGEYIGKVFSEVKHRPRYFIEEIIENN